MSSVYMKMHKPGFQVASPSADRQPDGPGAGLRIGFVSVVDPANPNAISGLPYRTSSALAATGAQIVPLVPNRRSGGDKRTAVSMAQRLPTSIRKSQTIRAVRSAVRKSIKHGAQRIYAASIYDRTMKTARSMGEDIARQLQELEQPVDVLFGACISSPLYGVETDVPIAYCSDATAHLMLTTYPNWIKRPAGQKRAYEELEQAALSRVAAGIFPSQRTLESAVNDYGLAPERAHLVPLGSSVVPDAHDTIYPDLPTRDRLELIVVAADPVRKRLDLCVDVARVLADRGWNVTLHSIGGHTKAAAACDLVRIHGRLSMADPVDRDIHKAMLRRSHFMLLPSLGEMFGIAPGEAAHFGRPSLVSAVGGLPTVVQHGKTGLCLPVDASAEDFADEIERVSNDPTAYRAMSDAALDRARNVLNWPAFARDVVGVLRRVVKK